MAAAADHGSSASSASAGAILAEHRDAALLAVTETATTPFADQKPGTSGLRKKARVFLTQAHYLDNFIQSIFDTLPAAERAGATLVVSGDGRFYNDVAIQRIIKIAAANDVARIWVGEGGLLSTPAVSAVIREREGGVALGGIILTASHNPGGPEGDVGVKYNVKNGGPAQEAMTDEIYRRSKSLSRFLECASLPDVDLHRVGRHRFHGTDGRVFEVEIISATEDYTKLVLSCFDVAALRRLFARPDFRFLYDAMHGVAGVYARRVFVDELGAPATSLLNCEPKPDFGGGHPDPNLAYAHELVHALGLRADGTPDPAVDPAHVVDFGAAGDGDADRNMILGRRFFVTPSDSVAIIAANADAIRQFRDGGGVRGVARSMPTSAALDRVATTLGLRLFEVPTGWKFFGNLMDSHALFGKEDFTPFLCGEESFGTGSSHIREKDGLWAVLAWLSILAARNADTPAGSLVSVEHIVRAHWARFGRNYYRRYDYEEVEKDKADAMIAALRARIAAFHERKAADADHAEPVGAGFRLVNCDEFTYHDPVDGSVSPNQGLRFYFHDGSRLIFRLSGTGSVGATIRMYLEKFEGPEDPARLDLPAGDAMASLVAAALELAEIERHTGRTAPTVIT